MRAKTRELDTIQETSGACACGCCGPVAEPAPEEETPRHQEDCGCGCGGK